MSTTLIIIVIAVIAALVIGAFAVARGREHRLEAKRVEARETRELADTTARQAEQERLQAEQLAENARRNESAAEQLRTRAAEVDPDTADTTPA